MTTIQQADSLNPRDVARQLRRILDITWPGPGAVSDADQRRSRLRTHAFKAVAA
ncbi:hypothetical protein ACW9HR_37175 [Nocardia gipuzkoensis]